MYLLQKHYSYICAKNLKELLCPSKPLKKKTRNHQQSKSFIKCEKECKTCKRISPSGKFTSKITGRIFTSRIEATCTTAYVIYLVTSGICGKQGVGSTEKLPARISNYYSDIRRKRRTNKISVHFQEAENHTEEDTNIQIIDRLLSIPGNQEESTTKLMRVEGFWQAHLRTVDENGF